MNTNTVNSLGEALQLPYDHDTGEDSVVQQVQTKLRALRSRFASGET